MENKIAELIECLAQIEEDTSLPKNIKLKIRCAITALEEETEFKNRANKAIRELEDISENQNVPSYVRPQIWNVLSMLEGL